ncbi:hypothetical protein N9309_02400 [Acidimicrobiia bacterium]|nr:hypothetical protein [Acidimicrobiia bacterium]
MENNLKIEASCGVKPLEVKDIIAGNNPDFVFRNDPNFSTTVLYDIEGNIINVNSWIECAHYVRGGWSNSINISSIDEERIFFIGTFVIFFLTSSIYFYLKKKRAND